MPTTPYETAIAIRELVRGITGSAYLGMMRNVMTTTNDLIIGGLNGSPVKLPIGENGQVLSVVDEKLAYAKPVAFVQIGNDPTPLTAADIGKIRYYENDNNSYTDVVMKTGVDKYEWTNIVTRSW